MWLPLETHGFVGADLQVVGEGLLFCRDRGLKSRRHGAWEMEVIPWDRELALPSLSSSERQQRRCDRWNLDGIDFAQASAKIFCLIGIEVINMHQQVSHCNLRPFTAAWSARSFSISPLNPNKLGHWAKKAIQTVRPEVTDSNGSMGIDCVSETLIYYPTEFIKNLSFLCLAFQGWTKQEKRLHRHKQ